MSNGSETSVKTGSDESVDAVSELRFGQPVYDDDGIKIGTIGGFEYGGFFVTTPAGTESITAEHARAGHEFGEANLMWRCLECGEMGELEGGLPETCPDCGTRKENLMYWTED